jgi:pyruvate dehydrogenase E1 component alpha subunit
VIYIIENNQYSMGTSLERSSAIKESLAQRGDAYNMAWDVVNGEDIYEIRARTQTAIDRAHNECRPTLLEVDTYRYYGHSVADANAKKYRSADEIEYYKTHHDPLMLWQKRLIEEGILTEEAAKELDDKAKQEADAAAKFAEESPFPNPEDVFSDVYYEVDHQTEAGRQGKHFFND